VSGVSGPANALAQGLGLAISATQTLLTAQYVAGARFLGLFGLWPVARDETLRMVVEKPPAFARAATGMTVATMGGGGPFAIAEAGLRPIRVKVGRNGRRLARAKR